MSAVFKREFKAYMHNVYGFLFMAILLFVVGLATLSVLVTGILYAAATGASLSAAVGANATIEYILFPALYVLMLLIPILCMRSMSEDRHNKTDLFYLSLPLRSSSVVLGKYLALLAVFTIPCGVIALLPLVFGLFGSANLGQSYLSVLFFFLIGAALIAICQFISSLTDNLVVSAVLGVLGSVCVCFSPIVSVLLTDAAIVSFIGLIVLEVLVALIAYAVSRDLTVTTVAAALLIIPTSLLYVFFGEHFGGLLPTVLEFISPFYHFSDIANNGILNLPSLLLLLSYPVFFIYMTILSVDRKRYA